jgi:hypothetical protein
VQPWHPVYLASAPRLVMAGSGKEFGRELDQIRCSISGDIT